MKSIADKLRDTVELEEKKNAILNNFKEVDQFISQIDKLGYSQKPGYTLPLVDTIGKTTYSVLNKLSV